MTMLPGHSRETRAGACELKFLVDQDTGARIREWARTRLPADPHGAGPFGDEYRVTSLYFDTDRFDVFHQRGSFGRSKYRVRRYGQADSIFLERKLRKPGLLHKRRTLTGLDALDRLTADDSESGWAGHWFHRRLLARRLQPVCEIAYHRVARVAERESGTIRMTVDDAIEVLPVDRLQFVNESGEAVLDGRMVIEVKYRQQIPGVFKDLIDTFALQPARSSKYRLGMVALGHVEGPEAPAGELQVAANGFHV